MPQGTIIIIRELKNPTRGGKGQLEDLKIENENGTAEENMSRDNILLTTKHRKVMIAWRLKGVKSEIREKYECNWFSQYFVRGLNVIVH